MGRVQGVGYRFFAQRHASVLGVRGYVRNLPDGNVEVIAQGNASAVEAMIDWCRLGPPMAQVEQVQVTECKVNPGLPHFDVRRD